MADSPNVTSPGSENEIQPSPTSPTSPTRSSSDQFYWNGEARVTRTNRRTTESPRANPYPNPIIIGSTSTRARRRAYARRWGWLPTTLNTWRAEEGILDPSENGEHSPMDISPYTQEPTHHTVPVLAARLHRHEERLEVVEREQSETRIGWMNMARNRLGQITQDQEDMVQTMEIVHQQVIEDRNVIDLLQLRLEQCELRSQEAEQYSQMLEQRLTIAEENARQTSRLAESVDHLISLLPQLNLHQD